MNKLKVVINKVRNIEHLELELNLEKGVYAITGENGCGKSTIMRILSKLIRKSAYNVFLRNDLSVDSKIVFEYNGQTDEWTRQQVLPYHWICSNQTPILLAGFSEGSLIYGTRFSDDKINAPVSATHIKDFDLKDADVFVRENFGYIMHNNKHYYENLKVVKTIKIARSLNLNGVPYFIPRGNGYVSQYSMSTGENLMLSLLHMLNTNIIRPGDHNRLLLLLVDEIEFALHPSAIIRLNEFLNNLTNEYNLTIYFSTHSREIIRRIKPQNIFHISRNGDNHEVKNPCFPAYATRDIYETDSYDLIVLVEDKIAKSFIKTLFQERNLYKGQLTLILPAGSWSSTIEMHNELVKTKLFGNPANIISILDGDIKSDFKKFKGNNPYVDKLKINFLPVDSIEKYLHEKLHKNKEAVFKKEIEDNFFNVASLEETMKTCEHPEDDKAYYSVLRKGFEENGHTEDELLSFTNRWIINHETIPVNKLVNLIESWIK